MDRSDSCHISECLRHLFEQPAESLDSLAHMQPLLHRPNARGHGVNHRNLQIFFEQMDDI